jgi:uncharacterized protein
MELYLPIANMSVNIFAIIVLGGFVGFLSGMFGLGGGFLITPMLIFFGIPPAVAAASASSQLTGTSISGVLAQVRQKGVDFKLGALLVGGGFLGTGLGALIFALLQSIGQIDVVINLLYVLLLCSIGGMMARDAMRSIRARRTHTPLPPRKRHHMPWLAALPYPMRFPVSGIYLSPLAPLSLGVITGIATALLGVGGGFILIPALVYIFHVRARTVAGTSLLQIVFVTGFSTMVNALTTHAVDIVLVALLLAGSVVGAQLGARFANRISPDYMRLMLATLILLVAVRMIVELGVRPDAIYTIDVLK